MGAIAESRTGAGAISETANGGVSLTLGISLSPRPLTLLCLPLPLTRGLYVQPGGIKIGGTMKRYLSIVVLLLAACVAYASDCFCVKCTSALGYCQSLT